jgi:hypothetical protein
MSERCPVRTVDEHLTVRDLHTRPGIDRDALVLDQCFGRVDALEQRGAVRKVDLRQPMMERDQYGVGLRPRSRAKSCHGFTRW